MAYRVLKRVKLLSSDGGGHIVEPGEYGYKHRFYSLVKENENNRLIINLNPRVEKTNSNSEEEAE